MPQIAQQDYLLINLQGTTLDDGVGVANDCWPELERRYKAGTLRDTILSDGTTEARIISFIAYDGELAMVSYAFGASIMFIERPD